MLICLFFIKDRSSCKIIRASGRKENLKKGGVNGRGTECPVDAE
jgi:hypothetical protein